MPFYEKGPVRIHYEERGAGFPLLVIPGGGLNSTIAGLDATHPFNARRSSATPSAASAPTCAMRPPVNPPGRSRPTGRGIPSPTTISA